MKNSPEYTKESKHGVFKEMSTILKCSRAAARWRYVHRNPEAVRLYNEIMEQRINEIKRTELINNQLTGAIMANNNTATAQQATNAQDESPANRAIEEQLRLNRDDKTVYNEIQFPCQFRLQPLKAGTPELLIKVKDPEHLFHALSIIDEHLGYEEINKAASMLGLPIESVQAAVDEKYVRSLYRDYKSLFNRGFCMLGTTMKPRTDVHIGDLCMYFFSTNSYSKVVHRDLRHVPHSQYLVCPIPEEAILNEKF